MRGGGVPRSARRPVSSGERTELSDITQLVQEAIQRCPVSAGIALVNTLHTTCALFVNEFQSALVDDLKRLLERLVPERGGSRPDDPRVADGDRGKAPAHLRATLLGRSIAVGIRQGSGRSASRSSASSRQPDLAQELPGGVLRS